MRFFEMGDDLNSQEEKIVLVFVTLIKKNLS